MSDATPWVEVRRSGDRSGRTYMAHPVPTGWRYCEKTDERFAEWRVAAEAEFWAAFERVPVAERPAKRGR